MGHTTLTVTPHLCWHCGGPMERDELLHYAIQWCPACLAPLLKGVAAHRHSHVTQALRGAYFFGREGTGNPEEAAAWLAYRNGRDVSQFRQALLRLDRFGRQSKAAEQPWYGPAPTPVNRYTVWAEIGRVERQYREAEADYHRSVYSPRLRNLIGTDLRLHRERLRAALQQALLKTDDEIESMSWRDLRMV